MPSASFPLSVVVVRCPSSVVRFRPVRRSFLLWTRLPEPRAPFLALTLRIHMPDWLQLVIVLAAWWALQTLVLPKLGVPT